MIFGMNLVFGQRERNIMEMNSAQQNRVALYLFNSINFKIKNCKSLDIKEQMF